MSIEKTLDIVRNTNDDNKLRRMLTNAKKSLNKDANVVVNAIEAKLKAEAPQTKEFVPPSNPYAVELQAIAEEMQKKYVLKFNTLEHNNVKTGGARLNGNRKLDFYLRYKMDHDNAVGLCIVQEHNESVPHIRVYLGTGAKNSPIFERKYSENALVDAAQRYEQELQKVLTKQGI
ncbi:hypothetical protein VME_06060 [Vibrio harveyi 1DA3]|nr:hypothetical protein VME_06060 [Vibrio harveyi 1DA3]